MMDNIKIVDKIASGMFGTTYLCKYKNKSYALKVQHILKKDIKKNYKSEMYREIDLYEYIDKMPSKDQIFFYKII